MPSDPKGLKIALQLIAEEKQRRTGFLDLGGLGLVDLPAELSELEHLTELNLGNWWSDDQGKLRSNRFHFLPNDLKHGLDELARLQQLRVLRLNHSGITSLDSIKKLRALTTLTIADTGIESLGPISSLDSLTILDCSNTKIDSLDGLENLHRLQVLNCSRNNNIHSLKPIQNLSDLTQLDCSSTLVRELDPIRNLSHLSILNCGASRVSSLEPLKELKKLAKLNCYHTGVQSLEPIADLQGLTDLILSGTNVRDLASIENLEALDSLDLFMTSVRSLEAIRGLSNLTALSCSGTEVLELGSIEHLTNLRTLICSSTRIASLEPVRSLKSLQSLGCSRTDVHDLRPLVNLKSLAVLDCSRTGVHDLRPLVHLKSLVVLDCTYNRLDQIPEALLQKEDLSLFLFESVIPGVPTEELSQGFENCRPRLLAYYDDLKEGAEPNPDVKVLVLGNGRIGKTQICRRLRGEPFEPNADSTHGIIVTQAPFAANAGKHETPTVLNLWDFGGQDLYHGTHTLFMKTRSIFLVVWASKFENNDPVTDHGMTFQNHELAYWLEYVRHVAGPDQPVIIVQTRCDMPEDEVSFPPVDPEVLDAFHVKPRFVHYSAKDPERGRILLDAAISEAVETIRKKTGTEKIGKGRLKVKKKLHEWRQNDASLPPAERKHRAITRQTFENLCAKTKGVSNSEFFLQYLHNIGSVFYQKGLFRDQIILDQAWALEAIYAVFHREKCYPILKDLRGRFRRSLLAQIVWQQYSVAEQELFLDMMVSCGICFVYQHGNKADGTEAVYLAPELLPDRAFVALDIEAEWGTPTNDQVEQRALHLGFLHPGLIRSVISRIGSEAGMKAIYWKDGICLYEQATQSHAIIETRPDGKAGRWAGDLIIQTHGSQPFILMERLQKLVEESTGWQSRTDPKWDTPPKPLSAESPHDPELAKPKLIIGTPPRHRPTYGVSYAWNDESSKNVDELCERASEQGIEILRDKDSLKFGESIQKFMLDLGQADRLFVILSKKYLESPYCMFELYSAWRESRLEEAAFRRRVWAYFLPCVNIFTSEDQIGWGLYWRKKIALIDDLVAQHDASILERFSRGTSAI